MSSDIFNADDNALIEQKWPLYSSDNYVFPSTYHTYYEASAVGGVRGDITPKCSDDYVTSMTSANGGFTGDYAQMCGFEARNWRDNSRCLWTHQRAAMHLE
jgi:hypothetical protein